MPNRPLITAGIAMVAALGIMIPAAGSPAASAPSAARIAAPGGLAPSGGALTAVPTLSWRPVKGAVSYSVEVLLGGEEVWSVDTVNRKATPTEQLPLGRLTWRVRSENTNGVNSRWRSTSFTMSAGAGPSLLSPGNGAVLQQPQSPPLITWTPVAGAERYVIEVDDSSAFVGAETLGSDTTSLLLDPPSTSDPLFWRVRGEKDNDVLTGWSTVRSFTVGSLGAPAIVGPVDDFATDVTDVVLEWDPVPGAETYEVRISTDDGFNTIVTSAADLVSTRWSPSTTIGNDQYWWQVRAVDSNDIASSWSNSVVDLWSFRRQWREVPTLTHPVDATVGVTAMGMPAYLQWDPIKHASQYELQIGSDPNFSPGPPKTYASCLTGQTSYTFLFTTADKCNPPVGGVSFWRVRGIDAPAGVLGEWSDVSRFLFNPGQVQLESPLGGTTERPILEWSAFQGAENYKVTVLPTAGNAKSDITASTTWAPTFELDPADGPFRWAVQAVYPDGTMTALPAVNNMPQFILNPVSTTFDSPTPTGPSPNDTFSRFPALTWTPVDTADRYEVLVGVAGTGFVHLVDDSFTFAAGAATEPDELQPGTYDWYVRAYEGNDFLSEGSASTFTIADFDDQWAEGNYSYEATTGHAVALTGSGATDSLVACSKAIEGLSGPGEGCLNQRGTPVLVWDAKGYAGGTDAAHAEYGLYQVWLSRDRFFTNLVTTPFLTANTAWTPTTLLADSQAGDAYYWAVRPCKAPTACAPEPEEANHVFDKRSLPPADLTPGIELDDTGTLPVVANQVTFKWRDYLDASQAEPTPPVDSEPGRTEARQYRVHVSATSNFQVLLDNVLVDQATYTAPKKTYPEGPLYWRVQAVDGTNNSLTWSATMQLRKRSDAAVLTSPANGSVVGATPFLRWEPQSSVESYDIEIYENGDTTHSASNRVIAASSNQAAYVPSRLLRASSKQYVWRVRAVDSGGQDRQWSTDRTFSVKGQAVGLLSPAGGAKLSNRYSLFRWRAINGAASYRFELRDGPDMEDSFTTRSLAWAPHDRLARGKGSWRVTSLDADGDLLAASAWRGFTVR